MKRGKKVINLYMSFCLSQKAKYVYVYLCIGEGRDRYFPNVVHGELNCDHIEKQDIYSSLAFYTFLLFFFFIMMFSGGVYPFFSSQKKKIGKTL